MRRCACGCGEELTGTSRQRFVKKNHHWPWLKKLRNRGVLPVKGREYCLICGGMFLVFAKTNNIRLCGKPECKAASEKKRQLKGGEARAKQQEQKHSMLEQTPYLYGTEHIRLEMLQRLAEVNMSRSLVGENQPTRYPSV
jgi:hypothetical protein